MGRSDLKKKRVETSIVEPTESLKRHPKEDLFVDRGNRVKKIYILILSGIILLSSLIIAHLYKTNKNALERIEALQTENRQHMGSFLDKYEYRVHWAGEKSILHIENDPHRDLCSIYPNCFPNSYPSTETDPKGIIKCHESIRSVLTYFDSGFLFERASGRVVGFVSSYLRPNHYYRRTRDYQAMEVYNVCVAESHRGQGLARRLMDMHLNKVISTKLKKEGDVKEGGPKRLYVGLDVEFTVALSEHAFALYAKMGFIRWWQPCETTALFDFDILERQHALANRNENSQFHWPMGEYFLNPDLTVKNLYDHNQRSNSGRGEKNKVYTHFCMIKMYDLSMEGEKHSFHGDSFYAIGKRLQDEVVKRVNSK